MFERFGLSAWFRQIRFGLALGFSLFLGVVGGSGFVAAVPYFGDGCDVGEVLREKLCLCSIGFGRQLDLTFTQAEVSAAGLE